MVHTKSLWLHEIESKPKSSLQKVVHVATVHIGVLHPDTFMLVFVQILYQHYKHVTLILAGTVHAHIWIPKASVLVGLHYCGVSKSQILSYLIFGCVYTGNVVSCRIAILTASLQHTMAPVDVPGAILP